jgi:hypothetical protein
MLLKLIEQNIKKPLYTTVPSAQKRKRRMTVLRTPAWARGLAANREAAEPARAPRPLGPKMARSVPYAESRRSPVDRHRTAVRADRANKTAATATP